MTRNLVTRLEPEGADMLDLKLPTHRRGFLGSVAATAAAFGLGNLAPRSLVAEPMPFTPAVDDPQLDAWLNKITGKHKQVYDMPALNGGVGFVWSRVFYMTNMETGVPESDVTVVVIVRHEALPLAMTDAMWAKYKLGEVFKINDPETKAPAVRNFMYKIPADKQPLPGISIENLMASGTLFGACNMAIKFYSGLVAKGMNMTADDVANDWRANLIPGMQVLPSGVWAVNRVQERGCTYCFAG
jgi:intracellular sulfur oxidation DsrE/DsrF family protein